MPAYTTQFTLFPTSNLVADASTNTWSCQADNVAALNLFDNALETFYESCRTLFPSTVRQTAHVIKSYDRSDPLPRAPVLIGAFAFSAAPTGNPLPPEVSLCGSFQAPPASGIPQARRRGRIFLGPLNIGTIAGTGRPTPGSVTILRNALEALRVASAAAATWEWSVFSTKNLVNYSITNGWVDDEYDTQRRRGRLPVVRTVFP